MNVSIIGWYGTETLGDRAILDGILTVLSGIGNIQKVYLGSLYPFLSERTLYEDGVVFEKNAPSIQIEIFDVKNSEEAKGKISESTAVIIGGGPLMDIEEMCLIRNYFSYAKRIGTKCIIMGCGVGPLRKDRYINVFREIVALSDEIWLRDQTSLDLLNELCGDNCSAIVLGDPAVISVEQYLCRENAETKSEDKYLVINFRDYPASEYGEEKALTLQQCRRIINYVKPWYDKIYLVPMHTFSIGGDDRLFLNRVTWQQGWENIQVVNEPMNLEELYDLFYQADGCIGMRYHAVLIQTLLNGNNYIVEYTNPVSGKIEGFINWVGGKEYYKDRRWRLGETLIEEQLQALAEGRKFERVASEMKMKYINNLRGCLERK